MVTNTPSLKAAWACLLFAGLGLLLVGCSDSPQKATRSMSAAELLEKMHSTYREAPSYSDNANYTRSSTLRSTGVEHKTIFYQMALSFERPNKLRFTFQEALASSPRSQKYDIASNGTRVRSATNSVPWQIHEALASPTLTPDNFIPEPGIREIILGVALENLHPPLLMLMADPVDQSIFPKDSDPRLLKGQKLGDTNYYRVGMSSPAGQRVLWIDSENYTLRRMELPIDSQRKMLNPNDRYSQISIYIDFEDTTLNPEIDAPTFELNIPEGARRVRQLIPPPPPAPSLDLGKPADDFLFVTLDGEPVNKETLAGKIAVLDFWFTRCPPCKMQTPVLEKVYQAFKDNEDVAFYAVSTDSPNISSEVVAKTMASWGGSMPVLRDSEDSAYEKLNIRGTPSIVMLGRDGRLQVFQPGVHLDPEPLTSAIQMLLDGEDLAAKTIAEHEQQVQKYEHDLEASTIKSDLNVE